MPNKTSYGIDFGTTNSTIALVDQDGNVTKIPIDNNLEDPAVMRSVIYVDPEKNFYFGTDAIIKYLNSVKNSKGVEYKTVATGKYIKIINSSGREETVPEIVEVEANPEGRLLQSLKSALASSTFKQINLFGNIYSIEELVGKFLKEIRTRANNSVGVDIDTAVFGRPVEYVGSDNELAISRMKSAAKYAGFKDVVFEYEPIGAAYDYNIDIDSKQTVLIFDFGGGTLDVSVVKFPERKILSNVGLKLGGDSFDSRIFDNNLASYFGKDAVYGEAQQPLPRHIFNSLETWYGISLLKTKEFLSQFENFRFKCSNIQALSALKSLISNNFGFEMYERIEKVKKLLTFQEEAHYQLNKPSIEIETNIKKIEFEEIISDDLVDVKNLLKKAVKEADVDFNNIDYVATTGGSSLIPAVYNLLVDTFGEDKIKKSETFTSVASGLAKIAKAKEF